MSIEIRNLPYFDLSTVFQFSTDQADELQTPQTAIDYQGNTYRTGLPVFPSTNFEVVNQPGNTFKIGDAVRKQGDGTYVLAQAQPETDETTASTHDVTGVVTVFGSGSPADKFIVTFNGRVAIGQVSGGRYETPLATGSVYYLSSGTPGLCTTAYPVSRTTYRPTFFALSATQAYVIDDRAAAKSGRFLDLFDVPSSYAGSATKLVRVNVAGTALEFFAAAAGFGGAFINLSDVPASYSGAAGKGVRVNTGATGLEFVPRGPQFINPPKLVYAPPLWNQSGTKAEDILVANPTGAMESNARTAVPDTLYNAVTTGGIPSGASAVILEAACHSNGPDNNNTGRSFIYIRKSLSDPQLLLLAGMAAGGGDNVMNSGQGIFPLASNGTFYFSKVNLSMDTGWYIMLVGYFY